MIKIQATYIEKPWAGGHFAHLLLNQNIDKSTLNNTGELILVSSIDSFQTYVIDTQKNTKENQKKITFQEYWKTTAYKKVKKLGYNNSYYKEKFPFLLKLLSVKEPLSLQVHPADEDLKKLNLKGYGKFESWYILESEENSALYLGLKQNQLNNSENKKDFSFESKIKNIAQEKNPLELFQKFQPQKNDLIQLNAGLVHGSQGKILFYEIQQPSDYTFRIFDFGRGRKLQIDESLQVIKDIPVKIEKNSNGFEHKAFSLQVTQLNQEKKPSTENFIRIKIERPFEIITFLPTQRDTIVSIQSNNEDFKINYADTFMFFKNDIITISYNNELLLLRAY